MANLGDPKIGIEDRNLPFFQGRQCAALSFRSLLKQLKDHGEREDLSFYVDPAGVFYCGRFQNWKSDVEVLQEGDNLLSWQESSNSLICSILPQTGLFHSQAIKIYTDQHPGVFKRVEGVELEFKNGEFQQTVWLRL